MRPVASATCKLARPSTRFSIGRPATPTRIAERLERFVRQAAMFADELGAARSRGKVVREGNAWRRIAASFSRRSASAGCRRRARRQIGIGHSACRDAPEFQADLRARLPLPPARKLFRRSLRRSSRSDPQLIAAGMPFQPMRTSSWLRSPHSINEAQQDRVVDALVAALPLRRDGPDARGGPTLTAPDVTRAGRLSPGVHRPPSDRVVRAGAGRRQCISSSCQSAPAAARAKQLDSVLEIGCATGELIAAMPVRTGGRKVGIDISAANIEVAPVRFPDVRFRCGDFARWRSSASRPVLLSGVLEHVPDDAAFLRAAAALGDVVLVNLRSRTTGSTSAGTTARTMSPVICASTRWSMRSPWSSAPVWT
jgi:hypothetical protein